MYHEQKSRLNYVFDKKKESIKLQEKKVQHQSTQTLTHQKQKPTFASSLLVLEGPPITGISRTSGKSTLASMLNGC
jgi:uncharacterized protein (DUF2345 family)